MVGEMAGKYAAYNNPASPWLKHSALRIEIHFPGDQFNIFNFFQIPRVKGVGCAKCHVGSPDEDSRESRGHPVTSCHQGDVLTKPGLGETKAVDG